MITYDVGAIIIFTLQMGKSRHKNEPFAQTHIASKWVSQDLISKILRNLSWDHTHIHYFLIKY